MAKQKKEKVRHEPQHPVTHNHSHNGQRKIKEKPIKGNSARRLPPLYQVYLLPVWHQPKPPAALAPSFLLITCLSIPSALTIRVVLWARGLCMLVCVLFCSIVGMRFLCVFDLRIRVLLLWIVSAALFSSVDLC